MKKLEDIAIMVMLWVMAAFVYVIGLPLMLLSDNLALVCAKTEETCRQRSQIRRNVEPEARVNASEALKSAQVFRKAIR